MLWHTGVFLELGVALLCPGICKRCLDSPTMAAKRTPFGSQIWHRFHLEVLPFISTSFLTTKTNQKKNDAKVWQTAAANRQDSVLVNRDDIDPKFVDSASWRERSGSLQRIFFQNSGPCNHWQPSNPGSLYMLHLESFKHDLSGDFSCKIAKTPEKMFNPPTSELKMENGCFHWTVCFHETHWHRTVFIHRNLRYSTDVSADLHTTHLLQFSFCVMCLVCLWWFTEWVLLTCRISFSNFTLDPFWFQYPANVDVDLIPQPTKTMSFPQKKTWYETNVQLSLWQIKWWSWILYD